MNSIEIKKMCREIYHDFTGTGRVELSHDAAIYGAIMKFYNTQSVIDWEEVRWLWMTYLGSGNLLFAEALRLGNERIRKEKISKKKNL